MAASDAEKPVQKCPTPPYGCGQRGLTFDPLAGCWRCAYCGYRDKRR